MGILIENGGLLTTVQDTGRHGYQRFGLGAAGAVDLHACNFANILTGNELNEAVLEATLLGPTVRFTSSAVFAVTGGDLSPKLNNEPCPMYCALRAEKGDVLSFGTPKTGCRAYIAFAGGLDIEPVMGSRSTYFKATLGGYKGRKLEKGDEIAFRKNRACPANLDRRRMKPPILSGNYTVRVLMGPQDDFFTQDGINTFLNGVYTVTKDFDRMGTRLEGPKIQHITDGNIITDGIAFGAIQVPSGGEPIIMLSDRQTTGGYTKIACVIHVDMPMIAQCKTGDTVRFIKTDIDAAQEAFLAQKQLERDLRAYFDGNAPARNDLPWDADGALRTYRVTMNGKTYEVELWQPN